MFIAALFGLIQVSPGVGPADPPGCAIVRQNISAEQRCADAPNGIIIASNAKRAEDLMQLASIAEERFVLRFGRKVPRYAIVESESGTLDVRLFEALERGGYVSRLPWLSPAAMAEGYRSSITRAVTAQAQAQKLSSDQTSALVAAALAQQAAKWHPSALAERETGTLPHELGHGWFIHAFWKDASIESGDHYGGPAPDWMDETAAVMMENDALAIKRREQFAAIYSGTDGAARTRLLDLSAFLSGGHPALPKLDLPSASGGVRVLTGAEAAGIAAAAGHFYLQARVFADYLIDRSGNPAAFRSAADAFALGRTTPQWLANNAATLRVPADIASLQKDWEAWLTSKMAEYAQ